MFPNVEVRQLHAVIVLAEELNFTRAADRLHITQPALSKQITDLEEEHRFHLFTREKRRVVELTASGAQRQNGSSFARKKSRRCEGGRRCPLWAAWRRKHGGIFPSFFQALFQHTTHNSTHTVFERLSRDLWPSLCALDVTRECHFRKFPR